jgi:hypothetical protein
MTSSSAPSGQWGSLPEARSPQDECRLAREAFARVAPGGTLPDEPTALQRMVYARMMTSTFIAAMADRVAEANAVAAAKAELSAAAGRERVEA